MNSATQKLPLEERPVTIHVMDDDGMEADRENVTLATLSWRCSKSGLIFRCPLGVEPGQACPVASKCHEATPEAWARFVRLEELDRLGGDADAGDE